MKILVSFETVSSHTAKDCGGNGQCVEKDAQLSADGWDVLQVQSWSV